MEKIASFTIDHLKLVPGLYVSRSCLLYTSLSAHTLFLIFHSNILKAQGCRSFNEAGCRIPNGHPLSGINT